MAKRTKSELKQDRNSTYIQAKGATTVANETNFMENMIDSMALEDEVTGTKTFTTTGTGSAYTVTDAEIVTNSDLDGKAFFCIFHTDSLESATIQFNALTPLNIKVLSNSGKSNTGNKDIKTGLAYVILKEIGINDVNIISSERITFTNEGVGSTVFITKTDNGVVRLKSIDGSGFVEVNDDGETIEVSLSGGVIGSGSNLGSGEGVYSGVSNGEIRLKSFTSLDGSISFSSNVNEIDLSTIKINDATKNTTDTWSSSKIEDRAIKTLIPVDCAFQGGGIFSATIPQATVIGDLANYFFVFRFDNVFGSGSIIQVNAFPNISIVLPSSSIQGEINYPYLFVYDGTNFLTVTEKEETQHIDTELSKGFFDGINEEARIQLRETGVVGLNIMATGKDVNIADDAPVDAPTNYIAITPPNSTEETGGIKVVSTHSGTTPEKALFSKTDNNTYPSNYFIVNDGFEEEFPPYQHQTLVDGATVEFDLYNGFIGVLDSGAATARTINFASTGSGGSGRVIKAKGYIYLLTTVTIDVSFTLDGSTIRVAALNGTHPLNIVGNATNTVVIPYKFYYDHPSGLRLFIGSPEIYEGI